MSLFKWNDNYLVGCAEIDHQHKRLFQLADQLHTAMAAGKGKQVLSTTLTELIEYTKFHFAAEEKLMQKHHYPAYKQHKEVHDQLTARVVEFQKDLEASRTVMTIDLMHFLKDWLARHIGQTDTKIAAYLKESAA